MNQETLFQRGPDSREIKADHSANLEIRNPPPPLPVIDSPSGSWKGLGKLLYVEVERLDKGRDGDRVLEWPGNRVWQCFRHVDIFWLVWPSAMLTHTSTSLRTLFCFAVFCLFAFVTENPIPAFQCVKLEKSSNKLLRPQSAPTRDSAEKAYAIRCVPAPARSLPHPGCGRDGSWRMNDAAHSRASS